MKFALLLIVLVGFSQPTWANCPSVDQTIKEASKGSKTTIDVVEAMACHLPICEIQQVYLQMKLRHISDLIELGEKTPADLAVVASEYADKLKSCSN